MKDNTIMQTSDFRIFKLKINGIQYYFVARCEQKGYLSVYQTEYDAYLCMLNFQKESDNGTLIL